MKNIITKLNVPIASVSVAFHLNRRVQSLAAIEDTGELEQEDRDGSQVWKGRNSRADWEVVIFRRNIIWEQDGSMGKMLAVQGLTSLPGTNIKVEGQNQPH